MNTELFILLLPLLLILMALKTTFVVKENQRLVVLRLGKVEKVLGPGLNIVTPFVDLGVLVDLAKHIPEWENVSEEELREKVEALVKASPNPKKLCK